MKRKYIIRQLSKDFYQKYDRYNYPEIERKKDRPYMVMLIRIDNNIFAIPFRTNIKHNACYKFKKYLSNYYRFINGELKGRDAQKYKYTTLKYNLSETDVKK